MTKPTRRAILGAIACTPVLAVSCSHQPAAALATDTREWDAAYAKFKAVSETYDALFAERSIADARIAAETPDRNATHYDVYRLRTNDSREMVMEKLRAYTERAGDLIDIEGEAAQFLADRAQCERIRKLCRSDEIDAAINAAIPGFLSVRSELMQIPAPHTAALLVKIEIACDSLDDDHAESVRDDARRLLREEA